MRRYPGIQPFSKEYKDVFYGRDNDIKTLYKLMKVNRLVLLHGKSGLGKSSLINAGLLPLIERDHNLKVVFVRFGGYQPKNPTTPKKVLVKKIKEALTSGDDIYFKALQEDEKQMSLWQYFKSLLWANRENGGVLIVFDQFEEVFTYPKIFVQQFAEEFSRVVHNKMPDYLRNRMYRKAESDSRFFEQNAKEIEFLEKHPAAKFLVSIRSDKLSFVDRLAPYIPGILRNTYELEPLSKEQAYEAVTEPAAKDSENFDSPPFRFEQEYLSQILDFLSSQRNQTVEPFILQILCQHFEDVAKSKYTQSEQLPVLLKRSDMEELENIVHNYYINVLRAKKQDSKPEFSVFEQLLIRDLIERKLIDPVYSTRISLDKSLVLQSGMDPTLLERLVDARLIRQEPNTVSGLSYEVSHDTLIDPILQSSIKLGNLEEQITRFYQNNVDENEQLIIEKTFFNEKGKPQFLQSAHVYDSDNSDLESSIDRLISKNILRKHNQTGEDLFGLYPIFVSSCQKVKDERLSTGLESEQKKRKRVSTLFRLSFLFGTVFLGLLIFSYSQWKKADSKSKELVTTNLKLKEANLEKDVYHKKLMAELETDLTSKIKFMEEFGFTFEESVLLSKFSGYSGKDDTRAFAYLAEAYNQSEDSRVIKGYVYRILGDPDIYFYSQNLDAKAGKVYSGAFSPKQNGVLTGYSDGTLKMWGLNGKLIRTLNPHVRNTMAVCISPDGNQILTGSYDYSAHLSDLNGQKIQSFENHTKGISDVAFSPDGQKILTGSIDFTAKLWDISSGDELASLDKHNQDVMSVAFAPDEDIILTASYDKFVRLWDFEGNLLQTLPEQKGPVYKAIFSPSGDTLITASKESVTLWDLEKDNPELVTFTDHKKTVSSIDISSDGRYLLSGSWDKTAFIRNLSTGDTVRLRGHTGLIRDVDFSRDDKYILTCSDDNTAKLWSLPLIHSNQRQKIIKAYQQQLSLDSIENDLGLFISQNDYSRFKENEDENTQMDLSTIKGDGVRVRRTPEISDQYGHVLLQLNTGDKVNILREFLPPNDSIPWYQVRTENKLGWVRSDLVEKPGILD